MTNDSIGSLKIVTKRRVKVETPWRRGVPVILMKPIQMKKHRKLERNLVRL